MLNLFAKQNGGLIHQVVASQLKLTAKNLFQTHWKRSCRQKVKAVNRYEYR